MKMMDQHLRIDNPPGVGKNMLETDPSDPTKKFVRLYSLEQGFSCGPVSNAQGEVFERAQFQRNGEPLMGKYLSGTWCTYPVLI